MSLKHPTMKFFDVNVRGNSSSSRLTQSGMLRLDAPVNHSSISPDGRTLLSVGDSPYVYLHALSGGARITFSHLHSSRCQRPTRQIVHRTPVDPHRSRPPSHLVAPNLPSRVRMECALFGMYARRSLSVCSTRTAPLSRGTTTHGISHVQEAKHLDGACAV